MILKKFGDKKQSKGGAFLSKKYNRILLKLSGEALAGEKGFGFDNETLKSTGNKIKKIVDSNIELGIVIGGGNFWRGRSSEDMDRSTADHIGMMATIMNSLALSDCLKNIGIDAVVLTALEIPKVAEFYTKDKAVSYLNSGKVVIFAGGIGNPFFSTDTAAALRACEIEADTIFLAKNIDAVYSADPKIDKNAIRYDRLTYNDVLEQDLKVMDQTAVTLCKENNISLLVFGLNPAENLEKAMNGENTGTIVEGE